MQITFIYTHAYGQTNVRTNKHLRTDQRFRTNKYFTTKKRFTDKNVLRTNKHFLVKKHFTEVQRSFKYKVVKQTFIIQSNYT